MGDELDKRLDENKYEMHGAIGKLIESLNALVKEDKTIELPLSLALAISDIATVLYKIEGGKDEH